MSRVHVASVDVILPDSLKQGSGMDASGNSMVPIGPVANVLAPFSSAATVAGSCGGSGAAPEYTLSRPDSFAPEPAPDTAAFASDLTDDGHFPHDIGFNFTFFGNTYRSVHVYSNGFLVFGAPSSPEPGANGGSIAYPGSPNNIIALAWADWSPQAVADGIRFQTRGVAPNRKFILQFNNVPEYHSTGRVMSQVVLTEGKNDITIYTDTMATVNSGHVITQGIENATGTYALYGTFLNALNMQMARVKNRFQLGSDAVRFTPVSTKDEVAPTFPAPPVNLEHYNDPGLATAVVAVAPPSADDNCSPVTVTGVRSDGVPSLDAPYPVGVTTITWTAKDADGNASTATQTVTVIDNENPVWGPVAESIREVNATSPSGAVVTFDYLTVTDNVGVTSRSCEPASGSVFPIGGPHEVKCTARDAAGNSADILLSVTVISAHIQIGLLIEYVTALDMPDGTAEPVVNQLRTAYDQTADGSSACKKVSDYLSMLQKKGSNIPTDQISYLTAEGTRILAAMGCPPPSRASIFLRGFQRVIP